MPAGDRRIELGLRRNAAQFTLLVVVNALVGGMLGQERTVLPLLGEQVFGIRAYTAGLSFILVFGVAKAATNYVAGTWSDRFGRKPVLVAGWLIAVPVPLLLIWAPSWAWVIVANVALGISQGLTWSTTVVMKIDLVGPSRRGLAMGLNEAAGYGAVAVTALATGYLAQDYGLRPAPFLLGIAFAALGLGLSTVAVKETRGHARLEAATHRPRADGLHDHLHGALTNRQVFIQTTFREPAPSSPTRPGGPGRSGPTGCGATAASRWGHCWPASSPMRSESGPPSGPSRLSPRPPGWSSPLACTRPIIGVRLLRLTTMLSTGLRAGCAAALTAALLTGCASGDGGKAISLAPAPSADQPLAQSDSPAIGISPGGVTTRVDEPAQSTEEQYAQACMAAKDWMDARGGDPDTLVEPYLKEVQAATETGRANFQQTWPELSGAQQAALIIAVRAAADGGC